MELPLFAEGASKSAVLTLSDASVQVNLRNLVTSLESDQRDELVALLAERMAADDFIDAIGDADRDRVSDIIVERAVANDALPDDYQSAAMIEFEDGADRLHEAICDGRTADACDLLREMCPDHQFMTDKARLMLAEGRHAQGSLFA